MPLAPKCEAMPITRVGRAFTMKLPVGATVIRAGIAPDAGGKQSLWYTAEVGSEKDIEERDFIAVMDDGVVPDKSEHRGMWWEGAYTFHLYELIED